VVGELERGLYEELITERLRPVVDELAPELRRLHALDPAEAPDRIALHLARQVELALASLGDRRRVEIGIEVARQLLGRLTEMTEVDTDRPDPAAEVLRAVYGRRPDGSPDHIVEPLIPLLDSTLLTNSPDEPALARQIEAEIDSAEAIDVVMAFIRRSGIRPFLDALGRHCGAGRQLRVLTTTYTDSTERRALDELADLGAQVRVSYDQSMTRLHAKAWVFHRPAGISTAYVGSSNLTRSAQVTGLEWNVRVSAARNRSILEKFAAVFDTYWSSGDFVAYDPAHFDEETERAGRADAGPLVLLSPTEIRPEPFQERMLELIELSRRRGHRRNLLVAATGTGKTVMAALDYARLRQRLERSRLLFVAHREELLDQALATFRHALRDASVGEKWVGGSRPERFEHVFASIQSLSAAGLDHLAPDHFDVVIVDEFHHAAAPTYDRLLSHLDPVELLGMTATPERSDGLSILGWFDDRIAAELRLWDAIDQHRLVPFAYYGIHDGLDLTDIPWRRGRGYDVEALSSLYTSTDAWARTVIQELMRHADDPDTMRCLGFCVSVAHARYMAERFRHHGIEAVAVTGETPEPARRQALADLAAGRVRVVFSVDLFNEGVDVPAIDTVLMLRPTESPTLFLQQLGRGLRRADGKAFCTVLDFVGTHRREFRFDRRLRALLGGTRREIERQVEAGFPFLPAGCHMQLDRKASEIVVRSLREAIPSRWPAKVEELRLLRRERPKPTLAEYLDESGLDLPDVYDGSRTWSDLCEAAGVATLPSGEHEVPMRRAVGRLLHVDDDERIALIRELLGSSTAPDVASMPERQCRLCHMLLASLVDQVPAARSMSVQEGIDVVWEHPQVRAELIQLLDILDERVDHLHGSLDGHPDVPLQVHARYSRIEILTAFGEVETAKSVSWQSGVWEAKASRSELFAFTLDKSSGSFSPTTRYRDYAISPTLIHWESQASTRADSSTGQRYRNHEAEGRSIMLFARLRQTDRAFWFLGPATYRGHTGERPMAITWELHHPLPGDLYTTFAAAVA
jgi:superfamily II DNA or RNA helicase/HKD family nuclease